MLNPNNLTSFKLIILEEADELTKEIANAYWELENDKFKNKPIEIAEKFDLTLIQLRKTINKYSHIIKIFKNCIECGIEQTEKINSQSAFFYKRFKSERCYQCTTKSNLEVETEIIRQNESEALTIQDNFREAIYKQNWKTLTYREYEVLNLILTLQTKSKI